MSHTNQSSIVCQRQCRLQTNPLSYFNVNVAYKPVLYRMLTSMSHTNQSAIVFQRQCSLQTNPLSYFNVNVAYKPILYRMSTSMSHGVDYIALLWFL